MANYIQDAKDALQSLKEDGLGVIWTIQDLTSFNPITGVSTSTSSTQTIYGILKSPKTFRGNTGYDETLEKASRLGRAKVFYCAAFGLTGKPEPGDLITTPEGIIYKIHAVTSLQPGGIYITHTLTLLQQ